MPADLFGLEQKIEIGPMSGESNVIFWLEQHNIKPEEELVKRIFDAAKHANFVLTDDEIMAIVQRGKEAQNER